MKKAVTDGTNRFGWDIRLNKMTYFCLPSHVNYFSCISDLLVGWNITKSQLILCQLFNMSHISYVGGKVETCVLMTHWRWLMLMWCNGLMIANHKKTCLHKQRKLWFVDSADFILSSSAKKNFCKTILQKTIPANIKIK